MRKIVLFALLSVLFAQCSDREKRILVFSKTSGYRHESIVEGKHALIQLGLEYGFAVDTTEDASWFTEDKLKDYGAVVFLNTTKEVLDPVQQTDFKRFIQAGGGFVGIHAAADTEYEWHWFGKLVGAYFSNHPETQTATLKKITATFGSAGLPQEWSRKDEWYNFFNIAEDINVIYTIDESTYSGGENGPRHPIAWYREFDGGRSFYTAMGHTPESYSDSLFLQHVLDGINYAIGENSPLDYSKATARRMPEQNRFSKVVLDFNLDEPTEMAILPDGRILFAERKGNIKLYTPNDNQVKLVQTLSVNTTFEDGVIGIAADPAFDRNRFVYIFYSHPTRSANIVSRFELRDNALDLTSEREIIEVPTQRKTCCHTGGSLAFGPDGNLYISTGDNTSPFESDGFSPSDERPDRAPFDAQGTSANTNDLRGKILRIAVASDGTYSIPKGNLFQPGQEGTRPEIYVMGCRNPYRISIDEKTGFLYWGEVGPDAGEDNSLRGPRGYDEVNQARAAGNFGWPLFVGKNYPYRRFDFASATSSSPHDADKPVNRSPNNSGLQELPPVSPPFIWYPYAVDHDFPMMKDGSRNAMAGPIYYSEKYRGQPNAFPDYFDGKLMIYDWMRNWIFLVSMNEKGDITDLDPFMPDVKFNNIIDMAYGPDGRLYMLEYGTAWFRQNLDARLVRIDYNGGNRPPVAMLSSDAFNGKVPMTVHLSAEGSFDPDGDGLVYELIHDGRTLTAADGQFELVFEKQGVYKPELKVTDAHGLSHTASLQIVAGNAQPEVEIEVTKGNKTFFFPESTIEYAATVRDEEDGTTASGSIPASSVTVSFDYLEGYDLTGIAQGHQRPSLDLPGKSLIEGSDCKACHLIDQRSAGPSYKDVARKYSGVEGAVDQLAAKIIKGGSGAWGTTEMAAHPQISPEDAKKMVEYIMTLGSEREEKRLPLRGTIQTENVTKGAYVGMASYADRGGAQIPSLASSASIVLRSPVLEAAHVSEMSLCRRTGNVISGIVDEAWLAFHKIDIVSVKKVKLEMATGARNCFVEVRLDAPDGPLIGKQKIASSGATIISLKPQPDTQLRDLYFVFKDPAKSQEIGSLTGITLQNR